MGYASLAVAGKQCFDRAKIGSPVVVNFCSSYAPIIPLVSNINTDTRNKSPQINCNKFNFEKKLLGVIFLIL